MNSSFPNRWSFSYLKFTKYVTNIIDEPKYKYGQQEQVTVRNHNRSTDLERSVQKACTCRLMLVFHIFQFNFVRISKINVYYVKNGNVRISSHVILGQSQTRTVIVNILFPWCFGTASACCDSWEHLSKQHPQIL